MGVLLLANRGLKRYRLLCDLHDLVNTRNGDAHFLCDFFGVRIAAELLQKLARDAYKLVDRLDHVYRDTDRTRLICDGACDRLANPPRCIGAEFIALAVIEFFDRLQ